MTPTISKSSASSVHRLPTTWASRPKRLIQVPYEMMATRGAPVSNSATANPRPISGATWLTPWNPLVTAVTGT
jgi:hypothetical protein